MAGHISPAATSPAWQRSSLLWQDGPLERNPPLPTLPGKLRLWEVFEGRERVDSHRRFPSPCLDHGGRIIPPRHSVCSLLCTRSACQLDRRPAIRSAFSQPRPGLPPHSNGRKRASVPNHGLAVPLLACRDGTIGGVHRAPHQACVFEHAGCGTGSKDLDRQNCELGDTGFPTPSTGREREGDARASPGRRQ